MMTSNVPPAAKMAWAEQSWTCFPGTPWIVGLLVIHGNPELTSIQPILKQVESIPVN
jgi:hypothetical protein